MGINHIEDLSKSELQTFIKNWNENKITITEKVDGSFMTFGLNDQKQFFLGSKNLIFTGYNTIPDIFFYDDFKKYYKTICKLPIENIFLKLEKKYNVKLPRVFEGEAIPHHEHNIVCYDLNKINNGVFVFFKTFEQKNEELWEDIVECFNKFSVIKFYTLPKLNLCEIKLNDKEEITITKDNILSNFNFEPLFGKNYEGLVIEYDDKKLTKIVNKEKFNKVKQINWAFINLATKYKTQFKNKTKKDISKLKDNLSFWETELINLKTEFESSGHKTLTIKKKKGDTQKYLDFCFTEIIQPLKKRLNAGETNEQVFSAFTNKNYSNIIKNDLPESKTHTMIFKEVNSYIPKKLIVGNITRALNSVGLDDIHFEIVGNNSKKYVGDLDVAINKQQLIAKINSNENDIWSDIKKIDKNIVINRGLKQFHIFRPLEDEDGNILPPINSFGERISKDSNGVIQVDFFVGSIEWMRDILSGSPEDSNFKSVYRNIFLRSIFSSLYFSGPDNVYYDFSINWKEGVKINTNKISGPKSSKEYTNKIVRLNEKYILQSGDQLARFLFGKTVVWKDIVSFEKLYELVLSDKFRYKTFTHVINETFTMNISEHGLKVPIIKG
jgi:hypothetical protein